VPQGDVFEPWTGSRLPGLLPDAATVEICVDVLFTEPNGTAELVMPDLLLQGIDLAPGDFEHSSDIFDREELHH